MKKLFALGLLAVAGVAQAVTLYSNGPVVDANGLSILPAGYTSLGSASTASQTLADNFSVTDALGWSVQSLDFFAYQTGATAFTYISVTWSIVSGSDVNTGTVVASGTTPVTNGGFMGYRVSSTATTGTTRPLYRISADIPDVSLAAGSYFVTWALAGSTALLGPFVPPVLNSYATGNGMWAPTGGSFSLLGDNTTLETYDVPFTINGVVAVPEPATLALMLAGVAAVGAAARRRRG